MNEKITKEQIIWIIIFIVGLIIGSFLGNITKSCEFNVNEARLEVEEFTLGIIEARQGSFPDKYVRLFLKNESTIQNVWSMYDDNRPWSEVALEVVLRKICE